MRSEREVSNMFLGLANTINELGGKDLEDDVLLDDLFNHGIRSNRKNVPKIWIKVLSELTPEDKVRIIKPMGIVNRRLSKINGADATLGDLRGITVEEILSWEGEKIRMSSAELLIKAFKK